MTGPARLAALALLLCTGATGPRTPRNIVREAVPELTEAAVDARLQGYWRALFEGGEDQRIYYPASPTADGPAAIILDVGNDDVRSEGMSYGMMIAVQMNRRAEFDALWNWAWTHMRYREGPRRGYFRWQCARTGCPRDAAPASDGEEYMATALFFAAHRWGSRQGVYDYQAQANAILDVMLHKEDMNGGVVDGVTAMFDRAHAQVVFVPLERFAGFTDPSYHLPAFYELWARWAAGWRGRRDADRAFWARAAHPRTALTPDYAGFDGRPQPLNGHGDFRYDAFRTAMNWSVDQAWWGADPSAPGRSDRLQAHFARVGIDRYPAEYRLNGAPLSADRSTALVATNGAASLAATHPRRNAFTRRLWDLEPPRGRWRYYAGTLQFLALLHATGRFRVWQDDDCTGRNRECA